MRDAQTRSLGRVVPFFDSVLFFMLFSGPPSFRYRDSQASLYGEVDASIIFQLSVWLVAGLWLVFQLWKLRNNRTFWSGFSSTHKISLALTLFLGISTLVSLSPWMTAAKVYQIVIEMLFCWTFLQLYGLARCLDYILWGSAFLCLVIGVLAVVAPDSVWTLAEGTLPRLRGGGIAGTNSVSAFAIILLLTNRRRISKLSLILGFTLFSVLQFLSLTRTSWIALAVILSVAAIRRPQIRGLKWVYGALTLGVIALMAGGLAVIGQLRDPDTIYDLSSRVGLWTYMSDAVMRESPWLGLGYAAATRVLGTEFNPELGVGHSIFVDVYVGGGILSLMVFLLLFIRLGNCSVTLLRSTKDPTVFAVCSLFLYVLIMGSVGETIDTSPFGFTFWMITSMLPPLVASARAKDARHSVSLARLVHAG
jgi:O-antigen ligase